MVELRELENELSFNGILKYVMAGHNLNIDQARWAFDKVMSGEWTDAQIAGLLIALRIKGHAVTEYTGAAIAMRSKVNKVDACGLDVVDTCGMGGTGISTFNVSTATAFVAAGAGVKVAKHGNRTFTRASGSANVLDALDVNLDIDTQRVSRCLREAGMCFCYAVKHHPAMKYAIPARTQLGVPTIFNVLGPLTNPADAQRQLLGASTEDYTLQMAGVLRELGAVRAMVVHSCDGLDELSVTAPNKLAEVHDGAIILRNLDATDLGFQRASLDAILVGSPGESADVVRGVLAGEKGPARDMVLLNAAAAIVVAELEADMAAAIKRAADSIDTGAAAGVLRKLVEITNEPV